MSQSDCSGKTLKLWPVFVDHFKTYSNPGDIVLDFTMGSGTAGVACMQCDRKFVGIEKDAEIFQVATERMGCAEDYASEAA